MENSTKEAALYMASLDEAVKRLTPLPDERENKGIRSVLWFIAKKLREAKRAIAKRDSKASNPVREVSFLSILMRKLDLLLI